MLTKKVSVSFHYALLWNKSVLYCCSCAFQQRVSQSVSKGHPLSQSAPLSWMAWALQMLLTCLPRLKWWCNEPLSGSCLGRKMIKLTKQGEQFCAYVVQVFSCPLSWCGLANVLPWTDISPRMFILDHWAFVVAESWAHSPCLLWFVFLLFSFRPWSKWPVNRVTLEVF